MKRITRTLLPFICIWILLTPNILDAQSVPPGTQYVASSRGRVFYFVGCSAWQRLSPANLRFFSSRSEAQQAGYTPSRSRGCAGPSGAVPPSTEVPAEREANPTGPVESCIVESVTDGDTLRCGGSPIRLLLIDAPEMDQGPWGQVAKEALTSLAPPGTRLRVEYDVNPTDRYNRTLAYLHLSDGRFVNEELLKVGVALVSVYPPNVKYVDQFRAAQEEAERGQIGLWAFDAFSCTPSDHRAGRCDF
jgi:endonuclease YncB( thermonuclease family)